MTVKITILVPTYNDEKYIRSSLESVFGQSYENWELLLIDDGSSDKTPEIVEAFAGDRRIRYIHLEENIGQLNALFISINQISGDYVTMLHSDDRFFHRSSLEGIIRHLGNTMPEGVYSDIYTMDKRGKIAGIIRTPGKINEFTIAAQLVMGGSNPVSDVFFVRRDIFEKFVIPRYIQWNMPYYYSVHGNSIQCLELKKITPWYVYRVYDENFIRSDSGKFEASNGCIRSSLELLQHYSLPFFSLQSIVARISLILLHRPIILFQKTPFQGDYRFLIENILKNYYKDQSYLENRYYQALLGFYGNYPSERIITIDFGRDIFREYSGKDARIFYRNILCDEVGNVYRQLLDEAEAGFGTIYVREEKSRQSMEKALKFLNLVARVNIVPGA